MGYGSKNAQTIHIDNPNVSDLAAELAQNASRLQNIFIDVTKPPAPLVGAKGDGTTDDTSAIQGAINLISSTVNNANGKGGKVYFPAGTYKVTAKISIGVSNIRLLGAGMNASYIQSTITNGDAVFSFVPSSTGRLWGMGIESLTIDGQNNTCVGFYAKQLSLGRFKDFAVKNCKNHGVSLEECWDSNFDGMYNTGNGDLPTNKHGLYIYNGTSDNSNRLIFIACHFEANNGSHVYSDSSGNSRVNGNNQFIGCKFHGKDPSALPGNNINTPHMYLQGDVNYVMNCYFYQCNNDMIYINGNRNKVIGCDFYNAIGAFVHMVSASTGNAVDGCQGQYWSATLNAVQDDSTGENFVSSNFTGENRKVRWNNISVGDNGGRLALSNNVHRSRDGTQKQIKGSLSSYTINIATNDVDGVTISGATNGGTDNATVTLTDILKVGLNAINARKPITFVTQASASTPNGSLFVDSADNKLKYKDNAGTVNLLY